MTTACRGSSPTSPTPLPVTASPPSGTPSPPPPAPPTPPPPAPSPPPPAAPPRISRTRILAFGDSLTAGTTSPSVTNWLLGAGLPQSYPSKLLDALRARYTAQTLVVENEGKPGEAAEDAVKRLPGLLQTIRPDLVIILHGVNDVSVLGQRAVSPTANFINTMAKDARFAGATVMIGTMLPQRAGGLRAGDPAVLANYNQALRDVARGEGAVLVDFATLFGDISLIGADGLHPTEIGYARMALVVFDVMRARFESAGTSSDASAVGNATVMSGR
ncbi:MAG: SGNH/GDSL hydrolase family protein [Acidobacteriota bacterium]